MGHRYYISSDIKKILYFFLCATFLLATGCSGKRSIFKTAQPVDPPEMHIWNPPGQDELEARRGLQSYLDGIERDIEKLFLAQEESFLAEENLRGGIAAVPPRIDRMEGDLSPRLTDEAKRGDKMGTEVASLKSSLNQIDKNVQKLKEAKMFIPFSREDYISAIRLFRDGNFKKSAARFKATLEQNPPRSIADNLHFGFGASLFKLKQYPAAIKQFNQVLENFPDGDKWFVSNLMLGFVHNQNGDKSKAIYVLHKALEKNPPDDIRSLIDRLLEVIEEGYASAAS